METRTQVSHTPASLLVIGLGGTISLTLENGRACATDNLAQIVAQAGKAIPQAQVDTISLRTKDSADLTVEDVIDAARLIQSKTAQYAGFILTTGTDTLEEVTYGLQCLLGTSTPVIVTGAMRPPYMEDYDGVTNLIDAFTACRALSAQSGGVYAVMGGHLFSATHVFKQDATRLDGFVSTSPNHPAQRVTAEMQVTTCQKIAPPRLDQIDDVPKVDLLSVSLGSRWSHDPKRLPAGLVISCPGAYSLPTALLDDLRPMIEAKRPVVLASRCVSFTFAPQSFYPGYAAFLEDEGLEITPYADLPPQKARLKLIFHLMGLGVNSS